MSSIVLVGSSPAEVRLIEEIRAQDKESKITLFCPEGTLPYEREKLPLLLSNDIALDGLLVRPQEFYVSNGIECILDQKITRININRKKIYTDKKIQVDYDVLFLGDTPDKKLPELKGNNKDGVYGFNQLNDIHDISKRIPLVDTVVISIDNICGLQTALTVAKRGKEAILVLSRRSALNKYLNNENATDLLNALAEKGVRFVFNETISEILGEGEAVAVRLSSGKVLAAQMIIQSGQYCDLRIIGEGLTIEGNRITTDEKFNTAHESVFALDKLGSRPNNIYEADEFVASSLLAEQGRTIAKSLMGEEVSFEWPTFERSFQQENLTIDILGNYSDVFSEDGKFIWSQEPTRLEALNIQGKILKGVFLINATDKLNGYKGHLEHEYEVIEPQPLSEEAPSAEQGSALPPETPDQDQEESLLEEIEPEAVEETLVVQDNEVIQPEVKPTNEQNLQADEENQKTEEPQVVQGEEIENIVKDCQT